MDKPCIICGGTGQQWLYRTWFTKDGFKRVKCNPCGGTGRSAGHYGDGEFVKLQRELREKMGTCAPASLKEPA